MFLPMYFAFNKVNYAYYGSYEELISMEDLLVQGQEKYPLRTAIDQRGEQTINRDAKTSGKIIFIVRSLL